MKDRTMGNAICLMPNCGRPAPAIDPFCSKHRDEITMMDNKPAPKAELELSPPQINLQPGWQAECPKCEASKFTCDEHYRAAPVVPAPLPNWADQRLAKAYALIDEVMDSMSSEEDVYPLLKAARDGVENADCELVK